MLQRVAQLSKARWLCLFATMAIVGCTSDQITQSFDASVKEPEAEPASATPRRQNVISLELVSNNGTVKSHTDFSGQVSETQISQAMASLTGSNDALSLS